MTGLATVMAMKALAVISVHAQCCRIKRLLLLGIELAIEGLGGIGAAVHFGVALGTHFTHFVDTLGRGQLGKGFTVPTGRALAGFHGVGVGGPSAFLCGGQLQIGLELFHALFHVLHAVTTLVTAVVLVMSRGCLCGGGLVCRRCSALRKAGHGKRSEQGSCNSSTSEGLAEAGHISFLFNRSG